MEPAATSPPVLVFAIYDGTQVAVRWIAPAGDGQVSKYLVGVTSSNGGPPFQASFDAALRNGNIPVPGGFQTPYIYACTVNALMVQGPTQSSTPVPVVTTTPRLKRVTYDGGAIEAVWNSMVGTSPAILSYTVRAIPQAGGSVLETQVAANATSAVIPLDQPLEAASQWQVALSANAAFGAGAATPKYSLITSLPSWGHFLYRGPMASADWLLLQPPPAGTIKGFAIEAAPALDGPVYSVNFDNPDIRNGELNFPVSPLAWRDYGARVAAYASDGIVYAASRRLAMIVSRPKITAAAGSVGAAAVSWQQVNQPGAQVGGYVVYARAPAGGQVYTLPVSDPAQTTATILFVPPLPAGASYELEIHATGPTTAYENSSDPVPVLITAPSGLSTGYDGAVLRSTWTAVTGAGGYTVTVLDGNAVLASASVSAPESVISVPIPGDRPYAVNVCVGNSGITGPPAVGTVIAAVPSITRVDYDPASGTSVSWNALDSSTGATGYSLQVLQGGVPSGSPVAVTGVATGTANIPGALAAYRQFAVAIRATATGALAPQGVGVPVITAPSELTSVAYDGAALSLAWDSQSDERISGYEVLLSAGNTTSYYTTVPRFSLPGVLTTAPKVVVRSLGARSMGPPCTGVTAIIAQSQIASAAYDDGILAISVGAVTGSSYLVSVFDSAAELVTQLTGSTNTAIAIRLDPTRSYTAAVRVTAGVAVGPPSPGAALICAPPPGLATGFNAATAACTVTWTEVGSATGYGIRISAGSSVLVDTTVSGKSKTSYAVTASLDPTRSYVVRVRTLTDTISGPWSAPVALLAASPQSLTVSYDGAAATLQWDPLPGALEYRASILAGVTEVAHVNTTGQSAQIALAEDTGKVFQAVVAAIADSAIGAPCPPVALFETGYFPSTSLTAAPHLVPSNAPSRAAYDIVLYLPNLFAVPPKGALPTTPPFVLATTTVQPFSYTLTIGKDSPAWTFDGSDYRAAVATAYQAFLTALEGLGATPLGIATVQDAIARAMPQTFAETLYYAYGFAPVNGYADLRPGTGLRVEFETYQYLGAVSDAAYRNGFVASSVADYDLGTFLRGGTWLVGLDSFIGRMVAAGGLIVPTPAQNAGRAQGGGGIADTSYGQFQQPFLRVVFPTTFPAQESQGSPFPQFNAVLVASPSFGALQTATSNLRNGDPAGAGVTVTYFRGRATPRPTIQVSLDGARRTVVLGTTLGDVVASAGMRPPILNLSYRGISLLRSRGCAVEAGQADAASGYPVGEAWPVRVDWHPANTYNAVSDRFDLPLLHGDRIFTGV
jgi:hypothetical protein